MFWRISHRADDEARQIADRHYSRQKIGSPQFVPPGRCFVLVGDCAYWVTSWPFAEYVKHAWAGAWVNSAFRRESGPLASELIRDAVAATRWYWPEVPPLGMVTFIDTSKVRHKRDFGRCYVKAGFRRLNERTKGGLVVMQMPPGGYAGTVTTGSVWAAFSSCGEVKLHILQSVAVGKDKRGPYPKSGQKVVSVYVRLEKEGDIKCVNWLAVAERIAEFARQKIAETMNRAAEELKDLAPGEVRTYTIEIGEVEISREVSDDTNQLTAVVGKGPGRVSPRATLCR